MKKIFYLMLVALTMGMFTACDDNDENTPQINNPEPKEQWGKTLRGDNQTLLAFPDIYADYWEYTYSYKDNPNIGLRLTGKFPKSRFFNFTVYNDETQIDVSSIEDVNIQPDDSSINPYVKETDDYGANGYTIYIIPANTPASARASMKNICEFPEDVNMVSIFMRLYLAKQYSGDEYGGVDMPAIQAFNGFLRRPAATPVHACPAEPNVPEQPGRIPIRPHQTERRGGSYFPFHPSYGS